MKAPLPEFLMEDWLEKHRFSARFNAGESGHRPQTLAALLAGLQPDFPFDLRSALGEISLCDAPNMGVEELRHLVAEMHPGAQAENVLITTGTSEALLLLLRQLQPRKVALAVPAFQLLIEIPRSLGAQLCPLPIQWNEHGQPHVDFEDWCCRVRSEKPDVLILNQPHNPSGMIFDSAAVAELLQVADSMGCKVIGDEHYRFLSKPTPDLGETLYQPGRYVTGSFIKCAGAPGLRIGWCVGDSATLQAMQSEKNYLTHTVNPVSQQLAIWFLQSFARSKSFFSPLHAEWRCNRDLLGVWLRGQGHWLGVPPAGGLVSCLMPRGRSSAEHERELFLFLHQQEAFLLPLSTFLFQMGEHGMSWFGFRIGLGLPPVQFKQMLTVMVPNILSE